MRRAQTSAWLAESLHTTPNLGASLGYPRRNAPSERERFGLGDINQNEGRPTDGSSDIAGYRRPLNASRDVVLNPKGSIRPEHRQTHSIAAFGRDGTDIQQSPSPASRANQETREP